MSYTKPISYSGLSTFKKCRRLWESQYILNEPKAKSKAADRGTLFHDLLEKFFRGTSPYPHSVPELARWRRFMEHLTTFNPVPEHELAVTVEWIPTDFESPDAYYRGKADLFHEDNDGETRCIYDWKSGRVYPDHVHQGRTYMALDAEKEYSRYQVKFVYLDHPLEVKVFNFTAEDRKQEIARLREDIEIVRSATTFDPSPSVDACKWCHLSWRKGGKCDKAP